jgi:hypothetical protein
MMKWPYDPAPLIHPESQKIICMFLCFKVSLQEFWPRKAAYQRARHSFKISAVLVWRQTE